MDTGVIIGGVVLILIGIGVIIIGISFVADIQKGLDPELGVGTADRQGRTYTFLRVRDRTVAWVITIITFILGAGFIVWGIVVFATG